MGKLDGKIALITGGTSGIGEASSRIFAEEGATVIIVGRNEEKGRGLEQELGNNSFFIKCDVSDEKCVIDLKEAVKEKYGKLDVLFNNAGVLFLDRLENIKTSDWKNRLR